MHGVSSNDSGRGLGLVREVLTTGYMTPKIFSPAFTSEPVPIQTNPR